MLDKIFTIIISFFINSTRVNNIKKIEMRDPKKIENKPLVHNVHLKVIHT